MILSRNWKTSTVHVPLLPASQKGRNRYRRSIATAAETYLQTGKIQRSPDLGRTSSPPPRHTLSGFQIGDYRCFSCSDTGCLFFALSRCLACTGGGLNVGGYRSAFSRIPWKLTVSVEKPCYAPQCQIESRKLRKGRKTRNLWGRQAAALHWGRAQAAEESHRDARK